MPDESAVSEPAVASAPARVIAPLGDTECRAVLERQRMCVVSMVDGDEPYAVPVFYGFDGETLYLGVAEGRKTHALDANPRVYVVVTEVGPGDAWKSVAVAGRARTLTEPEERQRAIDVLVAHNRRVRGEPRRESPPARRDGGRVIRIDGPVLSGRAFER
jgi:nitroimidazol reductase NimA-like FMN-containing flavoprotein (pyridoxamine 5'-phosphate oxidase superfamily)